MTYYKVVRVEKNTGRLTSFLQRAADCGRVVYRPGRWVNRRKKCGPLCVFLGLTAAQNWATRTGDPELGMYEIWRVDIRPSKSTTGWYWGFGSWDQRQRKWHRDMFPASTVLAHKVKLRERVYPAHEVKA